MITTTKELRELFERFFPAFSAALIDSYYMADDGSFTPHGICAEFSDFYRQNSVDLASSDKADLFRTIEGIVASDSDDRNPLANALCTCFLENISCTEAGEASRQLMGPASRAYFDYWHVPQKS